MFGQRKKSKELDIDLNLVEEVSGAERGCTKVRGRESLQLKELQKG